MAARVVIRSLGTCQRRLTSPVLHDERAAAAGGADTSTDLCLAQQTPEHARACAGTVISVAFEVRECIVTFGTAA